MSEHPQLLIDLGNSRLKWALLRDDVLEVGEPIAHVVGGQLGELGAAALVWERACPRSDDASFGPVAVMAEQGRSDKSEPTKAAPAKVRTPTAWISSTALGLTEPLMATLSRRLGITARVFRPAANMLGIQNAYAKPESLGSDRFLAMAGARARHAGAVLIADVGTALTLDLVDAQGRHHGGLIVPGPALMREALHRGTAGVRSNAVRQICDFADNTSDAVWSGAVQACVAVIERSYRQACARLKQPVELLLCGGAAPTLAPELGIAYGAAPDLVLEGLALWARSC